MDRKAPVKPASQTTERAKIYIKVIVSWGYRKTCAARAIKQNVPLASAISMMTKLPRYLLAKDLSRATSLVANVQSPRLVKGAKTPVNAIAVLSNPKPETPRYRASSIT